MLYNVSHRTTYRYSYPVSVGEHVACLKPRSFSRNKLVQNKLTITPPPSTLTERIDYFGNILSFFTVEEPHKVLAVARRDVITLQVKRDVAERNGVPINVQRTDGRSG